MFLQPRTDCLEKTSWTGADRLVCIWIHETDKEKRHVVFPRYSPEATQVWHSDNVSVAVLRVANLQLAKISLIVHIPAEDYGAEAKPFSGNGQELLLRHQLASKDTVDIDTGDFNALVILQDFWQFFHADVLNWWHFRRVGGTQLLRYSNV